MISISISGDVSEVKEFVRALGGLFPDILKPAHEHKCGCGKEKEQPLYHIAPVENFEKK